MKSKTRKLLPTPDLGDRLNMTAWRKHYVSSVTAEEEAWPQREPGSNLGRIFVLLLLLHVFIIGAVVLYNIVSPKAPMVTRTDTTSPTVGKTSASSAKMETIPTAAKAVTPAANPPAVAATHQPAKIDPPAAPKPVDGLLTYEVKSGDNVPAIASTLGVDAQELVKLNNLDTTELYPGRKLEYRNPSAVPLIASPTPTPARLQPAHLSGNTVTSTTKPKSEPLKVADKEKTSTSDSLPTAKPLVHTSDSSPDSVPKAVPIKSLPNVEDQPPPAKKMKNNTEDAPPAKAKPEPKKSEEAKAKKPKTEKTDKSDSSSKTASKSDKTSSGKKTHIVGAHETLYSISRKFGVSVSALEKANDIKDPTRLRDGSKIVIPSKS